MGDPLERPAEKALEDVRRGYVTSESAKVDYGVALALDRGEWRVDEGATRALRKTQKKAGKKKSPLL